MGCFGGMLPLTCKSVSRGFRVVHYGHGLLQDLDCMGGQVGRGRVVPSITGLIYGGLVIFLSSPSFLASEWPCETL